MAKPDLADGSNERLATPIPAAPKFNVLRRFEGVAPGGGAVYSQLRVITPEHLEAVAVEIMPLFVKSNKEDSASDDYDGTADIIIRTAFRLLYLLDIPQSIEHDVRADTYPQKYLSFTIGSKTYPVEGVRAYEE